jgi:hypothetical protein
MMLFSLLCMYVSMSDVVSSRLGAEPPGVHKWRENSYERPDRSTRTLSENFETVIHRYSLRSYASRSSSYDVHSSPRSCARECVLHEDVSFLDIFPVSLLVFHQRLLTCLLPKEVSSHGDHRN